MHGVVNMHCFWHFALLQPDMPAHDLLSTLFWWKNIRVVMSMLCLVMLMHKLLSMFKIQKACENSTHVQIDILLMCHACENNPHTQRGRETFICQRQNCGPWPLSKSKNEPVPDIRIRRCWIALKSQYKWLKLIYILAFFPGHCAQITKLNVGICLVLSGIMFTWNLTFMLVYVTFIL